MINRWVLLKNVHLAPTWLTSLEKKLHSIQAHSGFRLFLTCEITPKLPVNLLRAGRIFTFEPPPGIVQWISRFHMASFHIWPRFDNIYLYVQGDTSGH